MGRPTHNNWTGYHQVRNDKNVIVAAKCVTCNKVMKKRDKEALAVHKKSCSKISNTQSFFQSQNLEDVHNGDEPANNENMNPNISRNPGIVESSSQSSIPASDSENTSNAHFKDREIWLSKFFISNNIDFQCVDCYFFQNFVKSIDPTYNIPKKKYFEKEMLKVVYDNILKENHSKILLNYLCVHVKDLEDDIFVVSLAVTCDLKYIYLDSCFINKNGNVEQKLKDFCDEAVTTAKTVYSVTVSYVIHNSSNFKLNGVRNLNFGDSIHIYHIICCFSVIIDHLKNKHDPFTITTSEETEIMLSYYKKVDILNEKWTKERYSLAEAVNDAFQILNENHNVLNANLTKIIAMHVNAPALATNYLQPKFCGQYFLRFPSLMKLLHTYFDQSLPTDAFESFSHYMNKKEEFKRLFEGDHDEIRFWHVAKMQHLSLADFALKAMQLPAVLHKLNVQKLMLARRETLLQSDRTLNNIKLHLSVTEK